LHRIEQALVGCPEVAVEAFRHCEVLRVIGCRTIMLGSQFLGALEQGVVHHQLNGNR
jgi:hypothetical protein